MTCIAVKPARSEMVSVRGMRQHVLTWGPPKGRKLVCLHGWMDVGASFQFLVDALAHEWFVIAPDLRGFGRSEWQPQGYWFYDYLADLDHLVEHYAPGEKLDLVGHSLGGNVVMHYAGVRPERVRRLVSLEGFGIPAESSEIAPRKIAKWLDALFAPPDFKPYASMGAIADRLQKTNPRLPRDKAEFLARHWGEALPDGSARLRSDPRHKLPFPTVYRSEEVFAVWRKITAPALWIAALQSDIPKWLERHPEGELGADGLDVVRRRLRHVAGARLVTIDDAGHMLHHDQPTAVAGHIERFLFE